MRTYDPIAFEVTPQAAFSPTDGSIALRGRVFYDDGAATGIQFTDAQARTWDVLFADIPWYDEEHGVGARLAMALRLLQLALRLLAQRLPDREPIASFAPPTPAPGAAPSDPALLSDYLNTQVRPYIGTLVQETNRAVNAVITVANVLLRLTRDPNE